MKMFLRTNFLIIALLVFSGLFAFTPIRQIATQKWKGVASYYHSKFNGRKTATGEVFNNKLLTAANNFLKLGTLVKVTNLINGKSVVVKINDRMNAKNKRLIDLSQEAARQLDLFTRGVGEVSLEILDPTANFLASR